MKEILDFIQRRWQKNADWLNGNCYWFAKILTERFPFLDIYYLPIQGHFIAGDGNIFFDWAGQLSLNEKPILFSLIKETDITWYNRLIRDCVN